MTENKPAALGTELTPAARALLDDPPYGIADDGLPYWKSGTLRQRLLAIQAEARAIDAALQAEARAIDAALQAEARAIDAVFWKDKLAECEQARATAEAEVAELRAAIEDAGSSLEGVRIRLLNAADAAPPTEPRNG